MLSAVRLATVTGFKTIYSDWSDGSDLSDLPERRGVKYNDVQRHFSAFGVCIHKFNCERESAGNQDLDFKAVLPEAAIGIRTTAVRCTIAGRVVFRPLDSVNKVGLFHLATVDSEYFSFFFYFSNFHIFILLRIFFQTKRLMSYDR